MGNPFLNEGLSAPYPPFVKNLIAPLLLLLAGLTHAAVNTESQSHVNLDRYCGRWYEQARYENWFEKDMDQVCTDYVPLSGGRIQVTNYGTDPQGNRHRARGRAEVRGDGELGVSFVWPYWWFQAPYRILYVTPGYEGAVVSGEGEEYLWLLTRDEAASPSLLRQLVKEAQARGFDTARLRYTQHQKRKSTAPDTKKPG